MIYMTCPQYKEEINDQLRPCHSQRTTTKTNSRTAAAIDRIVIIKTTT